MKLFLLGFISVFTLLLLGSDLFSLIHIKQGEQFLQQLQVKKENKLAGKLQVSLQRTKLNHLILLNESEAGFILARLCETSHLLLTDMQLGKPAAKTTHNTFEVFLNLMGDYWNLMNFFNQLAELGWDVNWQAVHITLNHSKAMRKTKSQPDEKISYLYPLEIKLKLAITHQYFSTKKIPQPIKRSPSAISPFMTRFYAGKLVEDGKTIHLIATKEIGGYSLHFCHTDRKL